MGALFRWAMVGTLLGAACGHSQGQVPLLLARFDVSSIYPPSQVPTATPDQLAQKAYDDARVVCFSRHKDDEAKQKAELGNSVAAEEALWACLERAGDSQQIAASPSPRLTPSANPSAWTCLPVSVSSAGKSWVEQRCSMSGQ